MASEGTRTPHELRVLLRRDEVRVLLAVAEVWGERIDRAAVGRVLLELVERLEHRLFELNALGLVHRAGQVELG
jgi:hypothetical protein